MAKKSDSKTEALVAWVKKNLFAGGKLRDYERLIVFTEYKETLFFLEQRLLQKTERGHRELRTRNSRCPLSSY